MKNKKTIMFFSSILILIFHLWINIFDRTNNLFEIEVFIRSTCYIGVDIFFFLSSYSLSKNKITNYKEYLFLRFKKVYIPFLIFSIITAFYLKWNFKTFILTISGINLFIKGGGSFLWFLPAIMIVYLLLPLFNTLYSKNKICTSITTIVLWLLFTFIISIYTSYNQIFILTNRIPIMLIGFYFSKHHILDKLSKKNYLIISLLLIISGVFLLYNFNNINIIYVEEVFYLIAIPLILGLILLINLIPTKKILNVLGSITLEMYGIQMIFGYKISSIILDIVKNSLITNLISIIIVIMLSLFTHYIFNKIIILEKIDKS